MTARLQAMLEALVLVGLWSVFCAFIGYHIESKKVAALQATTTTLENANDSAQQAIQQYETTAQLAKQEAANQKAQVATAASVLASYQGQISDLQKKNDALTKQAEKIPACANVLKEQLCPALLEY